MLYVWVMLWCIPQVQGCCMCEWCSDVFLKSKDAVCVSGALMYSSSPRMLYVWVMLWCIPQVQGLHALQGQKIKSRLWPWQESLGFDLGLGMKSRVRSLLWRKSLESFMTLVDSSGWYIYNVRGEIRMFCVLTVKATGSDVNYSPLFNMFIVEFNAFMSLFC